MRRLGEPQAKSRPFLKIFLLTVLLLGLTIGTLFLFNVHKFFLKGPQTIVRLITDPGLKSTDSRTNILLLGIGGKGHDGPDLTDTIMLASVDKDGKDVALVSIPRDLWVPAQSAKINAIYAYGQEKNNQGLTSAKENIGNLLGIPIHYAFRLDFNGFTKSVDLVNGLDLEIENSFADPKYPIEGKEDDLCRMTIETQDKDGAKIQVVKDATGSATPLSELNDQNDPFTCRYETISYKKGPAHMDGTTALKFVRSRHGTDNEGSDFARSARQQKVILSFRQKVLSIDTLTNPKTIIDLAKSFGDSIDTDIGAEDVPFFIKLFKKVDPQNIRRIVLDSGRDNSVLVVGDSNDYKGQYVLVPKTGKYEDLSDFIKGEIFKTTGQQANQG